MRCPRCSEQNHNDAKICANCRAPIMRTQESEFEQPVIVKVSRLAFIAIALSFCGFIFIILGLVTPFQGTHDSIPSIKDLFFLTSLVILIIALFLGFISLIQTEISGGRKTGGNLAAGAIVISIIGGLLPIGSLSLAGTQNINLLNVCGKNLSALGKAMLIYANDYDDEFPCAAGKRGTGTWGTSIKWDAANRSQAYGLDPNGFGGKATVSASLYLLVKYAEVEPKTFICPGDPNVSEFVAPPNQSLISLWDFGPESWKHISYAYHMPYGKLALTTSSEPDVAVIADRNPWIPSTGWPVKDVNSFNPDGDRNAIMAGNSFLHGNEGQIVSTINRASFQRVSFCGVNQDNIYTSWNASEFRKGTPPKVGSQPVNRLDSLLVNDPPVKKR